MSPLSTSHLRLAGLAGALAIGLAACGTADASDPVTAPEPTASETDSPETDAPDAEPPMAQCSSEDVDLAAPDLSALPEATRTMAQFLLDAALRCDEQLLVTAATESQTRLTFGNVAPGEFLALPEADGAEVYALIARLIAGTTFAQADGIDTWVFPAVTTGNGTDADWQSLVTAGLYTQAEADQLRAAGDGYLGWRLGIDAQGNWTFLVAGD